MDTILFRYLILSDGLTSPQDRGTVLCKSFYAVYELSDIFSDFLNFINIIEYKKFFLEDKQNLELGINLVKIWIEMWREL